MKLTEKRQKNKDGYLILPKEFIQGGWCFKQLYRAEDKAIYEKTKNSVKSIELIKISTHDGYTIAGNIIPPSEVYPGNEQWGTLGWSFSTLNEAMNKLKTI